MIVEAEKYWSRWMVEWTDGGANGRSEQAADERQTDGRGQGRIL